MPTTAKPALTPLEREMLEACRLLVDSYGPNGRVAAYRLSVLAEAREKAAAAIKRAEGR